MGELLNVRDLVTTLPKYGRDLRLLDGVSFSVAPGEAFGLVGESGSGKSMTCRSILRILQRPLRVGGGSIAFEGRETVGYSEKEMRGLRGSGISMVFQDPMTSLNPVLTIGDQLMEVLDASGGRAARKARAAELLAHVGIPSPEQRLGEYPHQFSGGMRQRAMIAIAIARGPRLLLADEPTTALDVTIQAQVLDLLDRLRRERNMGMILVSHDLGVISENCDRVAVMYAGEIVELAPKDALFSSPRHPYTLGLMGSMPDMSGGSGALRAIPGMPPNLARLPEGCRFGPRCPYFAGACGEGRLPLERIGEGRYSRCMRAGELPKLAGLPERTKP